MKLCKPVTCALCPEEEGAGDGAAETDPGASSSVATPTAPVTQGQTSKKRKRVSKTKQAESKTKKDETSQTQDGTPEQPKPKQDKEAGKSKENQGQDGRKPAKPSPKAAMQCCIALSSLRCYPVLACGSLGQGVSRAQHKTRPDRSRERQGRREKERERETEGQEKECKKVHCCGLAVS